MSVRAQGRSDRSGEDEGLDRELVRALQWRVWRRMNAIGSSVSVGMCSAWEMGGAEEAGGCIYSGDAGEDGGGGRRRGGGDLAGAVAETGTLGRVAVGSPMRTWPLPPAAAVGGQKCLATPGSSAPHSCSSAPPSPSRFIGPDGWVSSARVGAGCARRAVHQ